MPDLRHHADRPRWPWISLIPLGIGAWAPILAGVRARCSRWVALGVLWTAVALAGWIGVAINNSHHHASSDFVGFLLLLGWVGGAATSFTIRGAYERRMASPVLGASERARERLDDRARARELAHRNPTLAAEMGVGRPDLPGAADAGLVDVNNAGVKALLRLPAIDDELATKITEARASLGGFSSLEDLGATLDLSGEVVEGLRDRTVFLPRAGLKRTQSDEIESGS
jgi:DNA uptake protein ComE-like DNA-binding protein